MKNAFKTILPLLLSVSLLAGCGGKSTSSGSNTDNSSNSETSQSGDNSSTSGTSQTSGDSSSQQQTNPVDEAFKKFLNGTNVDMPLVPSGDYTLEALYSYEYDFYFSQAYCDGSKQMETDYLNAVKKAGLICYNDEDYTYEEYGYMYVDDDYNPLVEIDFYYEQGEFVLVLYRYDGQAGTYDVSHVDTNWYVDYINFYGFEKSETFPLNSIQSTLGITANIPSVETSYYIHLGYEADAEYAAIYYVYVDGNECTSYATALSNAGFTVNKETVQTFDWETWDYVEYDQYMAYDNDHQVVIKFHYESETFTNISFECFDDLYVDELTTNTDWTDQEKQLMNSGFCEVLPFVKLGKDYVAEYDDYYECYSIYDTYYSYLLNNYGTALEASGFALIDDPSDPYEGCYYKDNHDAAIYVAFYYSEGNWIDVYVEESSYIEATDLTLGLEEVTAISGHTFNLEATVQPSDATGTVTYTSSNEEVATVDASGLVTIVGTSVGSSATITAKIDDCTATCVVTIASNTPTDVVISEHNATIYLGNTYTLTGNVLPLGVGGVITWTSSNDTVATVSDGVVSLTNNAKEGDTFDITASYESLMDTCSFVVASKPQYEKVTTNLSDYTGQYLIVYESDFKIFDGSIEDEMDASGNIKTVSFAKSGVIDATEAMDACSFTIEKMSGGYSIQSASGYYIGNSNNSNKLPTSKTTPMANSITVSDGVASIVSSGGAHLAFNSSDNRFRYYKSSSQITANIALYKLSA